MIVVRPVTLADEESLFALSALAQAGLTSLPHDRDILHRKIKLAQRSFTDGADRPGTEMYLFVAEDLSTHTIIGTSAIYAKVGGFEPFYTYKVCDTVKISAVLGVRNQIDYLELIRQHDGPSEIGTLFLAPDQRGRTTGRLLSLARFLFMAQYPQAFEKEVIAEMRGVIDEAERSPFWEALGKHFCQVEFRNADMMVLRDKSFIKELMPQHPIYICLLPPAAQAVIGQVHENTRPALHLLQSEGFVYNGEIDIFEAGPVVRCPLTQIRTVRDSAPVVVSEILNDGTLAAEPVALIANVTEFARFRAVTAALRASPDNTGIAIEQTTAHALHLNVGDAARVASIHSQRDSA